MLLENLPDYNQKRQKNIVDDSWMNDVLKAVFTLAVSTDISRFSVELPTRAGDISLLQ